MQFGIRIASIYIHKLNDIGKNQLGLNKMKFLNVLLAWSLAMLLSLAVPAGAAPIKNITNDTISSSTSSLSLTQIADVITVVGLERGWVIRRTGNNTMQGRLDVRRHTAVIDIKFSKKAFSINYNTSRNLNYRDGNIHNNYNRWVKNLEKDIVLGLKYRSLR